MNRWKTLPMLTLLGLAGCDQEIVVDVTVSVPAAIQARYSRAAPGRLMVGMEIPKSSVGWYSLAVLCDPSDGPLVASLRYEGIGCAKAGTVRAWIVPVPAGEAAPCGVATTRFDAASAPDAQSVQGSAPVFAEQTGSAGCSSGSDRVAITLASP